MEKAAVLLQLEKEYVLKSKSAVVGILSVAILFIYNGLSGSDRYISWFLLVGLLLINAFRFQAFRLFRINKITLDDAIQRMVSLTILNASIWMCYSLFLMIKHNFQMNIFVILCVACLIGFANSLITMLYWSQRLINYCWVCYTGPLILFSAVNFYEHHEYAYIIWIMLTMVNLFFIKRQSRLNFYEAAQRITLSEKLKDLIEDNHLAHMNLQKETFNKLQASKLSSLVELASGIAHEINNPLTVLRINNNKMIEKELGEINEKQAEKLEKNRIAIERIEKVVGSFSSVTGNISNEEFKENDIKDIMNSVLEIYQDKCKIVSIKIENKLVSSKVVCVAPQVSQIFINVLNNAYDALLSVTKDRKIIIDSHISNEWVEIIIKNNGPKIPKDKIDNIFLPFYTTKEFGAGTGLGLTLSRSLANGNGGAIDYIEVDGFPAFIIKLRRTI